MATALAQGIAAHYAVDPVRGFDREVYQQLLLPNYWESNYVTQVTQNVWGGSGMLQRKGGKLVFTRTPTPQINNLIEGQPILIQRWRPETVEYVPKRKDYIAVADTPVSAYFNPYSEKSVMMTQGDMAKMTKLQVEFLEFALGVAARNPENNGAVVGNTLGVQPGYAGLRSRGYLIGSPTRPVFIGASHRDLDAVSAYTCPKAVAYDLLANGISVIDEQSMAGELKAFKSYAIMPRIFMNKTQLALARQATPGRDQNTSWIFGAAEMIFSGANNPAGFDNMFADNMLPIKTVAAGAGQGNAPAGTVSIPIICGLSNAISYDQGFSAGSANETSQDNFDSVDKKMWMYDYYSLFDKFLCVIWITPTPYNVNV